MFIDINYHFIRLLSVHSLKKHHFISILIFPNSTLLTVQFEFAIALRSDMQAKIIKWISIDNLNVNNHLLIFRSSSIQMLN